MLKNYLTVILRNIKRHKGYAFINITGLAVGIASCILILLFVQSELGYDRFHDKFHQIYRIPLRFHVGINQFDCALAPSPLAQAMVEDFPEVIASTRIFKQFRTGNVYVRFQDRQFKEEQFLWVDSTFFDVFSISLLEGDKKSALAQPNSVILTPATAARYFGSNDPMGKILILEDKTPYTVTGIAQPMPENSHFHFDFLATFATHPKSRDPDWYDTAVYTYIVTQENTTLDQIEAKFPEFSRKYYTPVVQKLMGITYDKFLEAGNFIGFFLQPLKQIHLHSAIENEIEPTGNVHTVVIFSAIALIIMIIACINFINLTTARSSQRAKEVGIRKVIGSLRRQLIRQFLAESILFSFLALILASILVEVFLPAFNNLVGKHYSASIFQDWPYLLGIMGGALILGTTAGAYPAFLLSSFQPVDVIKHQNQSGLRGRKFRNTLVIFQFVASIILFIGTIIIYNQLHFIRNKQLGFDKEHLVVIQGAAKLGTGQQSFKNTLKINPDIVNATYTDSLPQMLLEVKVFQKKGEDSNVNHTLITLAADYDFQETYGVKLREGRFFQKDRSTDTTAIILNEAAVKALNLQQPLGKQLILKLGKNPTFTVIGTFADFHLESLHFNIRPMAAIFIDKRPGVYLSVRLRPENTEETLDFIKKQWAEFVPGQPLEYVFYDDQFEQTYGTEVRSGKVFSAFAVLSILIACLGLFGLASFITTRRTKEIGIRKVLGATIPGILLLLNKEFITKVLIANLIAWPVAYYVMRKWLQNFAFQVNIDLWIFIAAAALALIIAIVTVSYQSLKAAHSNPAHSLRYE